MATEERPGGGGKRGQVNPNLDQHIAHEVNRNGNYYCSRLGAACDFGVVDLLSDELMVWIETHGVPFNSLYFYGAERPIHISYGPQHKRDIWALTEKGTPIRTAM